MGGESARIRGREIGRGEAILIHPDEYGYFTWEEGGRYDTQILTITTCLSFIGIR